MRRLISGVVLAACMLPSLALAELNFLNKWSIERATDPLTDDVHITTGVGVEDGLHYMLQCSSGSFGVIVAPLKPQVAMEFITMDSTAEVTWRVDEEPAITEEWHILPARAGRNAVVINTDAEDMAMAVMNANDRLVLRVHGVTGVFSVEGAAEHIQQVLEHCDIAY